MTKTQLLAQQQEQGRQSVLGDNFIICALHGAIYSVLGYCVSFVLAYCSGALVGMMIWWRGDLSLAEAIGRLFAATFVMCLLPWFWPFILIAAFCFYLPMKLDTLGVKVIGLIVLVVSSYAAYGYYADLFSL